MISQSMAREYRPKGIHVTHVVIDSTIRDDRLEKAFQEREGPPGRASRIRGDHGELFYGRSRKT